MGKRCAVLCLLLAAMLPLAGCWDSMELEQRGFVIGVAIDEGSAPVHHKNTNGKQSFKVTFQEVIPAGLKQDGNSGSSLAGDSYFNITLEGKTMLSVIAKMSTMTSRTPFFEHLKLIVISEKVAQSEYGFANVLDYFLRNNDARRNVSVMVAKGEAKSILSTMPQGEKTPVMFIQSISKNQDTYRMVPETRIGDIHEYLLKRESFVIQKVTSKDSYISLIGGSIMDGVKNNLVGFMDEMETAGFNFLRQGIKGGVLEVDVGDNLVAYKVEQVSRRVKANLSDPSQPKFTIQLWVEGGILEAFERKDYLEQPTIEEIQERVKESVQRLVNETLNKTQKQLKRDVLGLGNHLKEWHPKVWKQLEQEWETGRNTFSQSEINVVTNVEIRRIGSVNNTEKR
ncbi:Ger(x)C family spore germination protein [Paenibacillus sp. 1011MAR3C5]|uniref:Ger(x)C family spore germination protein n=1 Tax=Paenibacillus sp. 1011MAR3C5 TaxID=1675787 RepID=UPI000E6C1BB7|nr:Ger(x)C family spore germination protein [Paenibacillus sp. 1011MAR3C5]RJE90140.1 Ger(x)C family spore germination protein [Paenibacillus sp. 1011MAR3C5]